MTEKKQSVAQKAAQKMREKMRRTEEEAAAPTNPNPSPLDALLPADERPQHSARLIPPTRYVFEDEDGKVIGYTTGPLLGYDAPLKSSSQDPRIAGYDAVAKAKGLIK
jgi:hypothetical protein